MARRAREHIRKALYLTTGLMLIWATNTIAAPSISAEVFDVTFWFRALLSGLLMVLVYLAKGNESRLKNAEERINSFDTVLAERKAKLEGHEGSILWMSNEIRTQANSLDMLEKLILKNYHDKDETNQHRARVENELREIRNRLDNMARPHHRHSDGGGEHGA